MVNSNTKTSCNGACNDACSLNTFCSQPETNHVLKKACYLHFIRENVGAAMRFWSYWSLLRTFTEHVTFFPVTSPVSQTFVYLELVFVRALRHTQVYNYC